ncbi:toprim domain-containing protein [Dickeya oryzae]|uniref:Toprim domain-containing protein n=1 Tax=Dickeya oryzae TaxID=1240404 RepID=A0ABS5B6U1_9GAMM|nr:toprim domain-containing protein [Dickeya oryzae]MBP2856160.1 toprim domain-containing protein [Dickeya oryzae]
MNTQQAAIGRWPDIYQYYGLPPVTGKNHFKGECPICGRRGKLRIDDKNGTGSWICTCGAGDGWAMLTKATGKDFGTLAGEVDRLIGNVFVRDDQSPAPKSAAQAHREKVVHKFPGLVPLRGTGAEQYLRNRGITSLPTEAIRYCDSQRANGGVFQAIYSLATDDTGALCYLHRTLLDGDKKADIGAAQKKLTKLQEDSYLEHAGSIAIRMFPVATTLGIAEGIETALSCHQLTRCNVWPTLNTAFMKKFRVPRGVTHLIIFADADNNAAGHAAAFECARANLHAKNDLQKVSVRWPQCGDFNDLLTNGAEVYEWTFTREDKNQ